MTKKDKQVKIFLLGLDCTDETTNKIADTLKNSINRLLPGLTLRLSGQCIDSGGGGTKYALLKALTERNMTGNDYLVSTCLIHNLQTCLRKAVTNIFGEGGMNENDEPVIHVMQMLHGSYNI